VTLRVSDAVSGVVVAVTGVTALVLARAFPEIPGEPGPALFPRIAGIGLLVCAAVLVAGGWRRRATTPWVEFPDWIALPRRLAAVAVIVAGLGIMSAYLEVLGFFICAPVLVAALLIALSVRTIVAVPVAAAATLLVHAIFYSALRVALPWGVFERFAW